MTETVRAPTARFLLDGISDLAHAAISVEKGDHGLEDAINKSNGGYLHCNCDAKR